MRADPRLLRSFTVLADELHFGRAAARLGIAQPALSQQIKRLELQLGVTLFERSRNHVELTRVGHETLAPARSSVAAAEAVDEIAQAHLNGDRGDLRLGVSPGVHYVAEVLLAEHARRRREVHVRARQDSTGALSRAVARGELDLALGFCALPEEPLVHERLLEEPAVLAVADSHALAQRQSVALTDLRSEVLALVDARDGPGYNRAVISLCRTAGFEPRTVEEPSGPMAWETAVRSGGAVGLTARCAAVSSVRGVRLVALERPPSFALQLVAPPARRPVAAAFARLAREMAAEGELC
ncbi:MAG TPA: LysR substrate-binding domain-containing protein [Thermoleophilaceae bacterium]|jgi:LysR family transcriptional regulator, benzoate and cis,cis-muconate-responsive activator of ben and cat genes|nr:LysR substrate-binding domain-containing protein [Thermoleophilaceae bacterium]